MMNFFTSFGASTKFQKNRLQATVKSMDAPSEQSIKIDILKTFQGEDEETRSQIAFATIVKKILTSNSKQSWMYMLKNLIIIDRVVEENLFTFQISELSLPTVENFKQTDGKYIQFDTQRIIKSYWKLIKEKSTVLSQKKHIFGFKRSQRMQFLSSLSSLQTLKQIESCQSFFAMTFDLVDTISGQKQFDQMKDKQAIQNKMKYRQQFTSSKLIEFLYLQILHKFMLYYSCQLLCNNYFIQLIMKNDKNIKEEEIKRYKKDMLKFKSNADLYIKFVEARKKIKGFQEINYKELNPFQNEDIIKLIDQYINQRRVENENPMHTIETLTLNDLDLKVEKKPHSSMNKSVLNPRIRSIRPQKQIPRERNAFLNWTNSYSSQFPQKEVMTVDLILQIKKEVQDNIVDDDPIIYKDTRNSYMYDYEETTTTNTLETKMAPHSIQSKFKQNLFHALPTFDNIYSKLNSVWNQV